MSERGKEFVEMTKKKEQDIFVENLIELARMIKEGELSSTGGKEVFQVMWARHRKILATIDTLGEKIT